VVPKRCPSCGHFSFTDVRDSPADEGAGGAADLPNRLAKGATAGVGATTAGGDVTHQAPGLGATAWYIYLLLDTPKKVSELAMATGTSEYYISSNSYG
jgi:hypothetical protein